jgi:hypothetical protein
VTFPRSLHLHSLAILTAKEECEKWALRPQDLGDDDEGASEDEDDAAKVASEDASGKVQVADGEAAVQGESVQPEVNGAAMLAGAQYTIASKGEDGELDVPNDGDAAVSISSGSDDEDAPGPSEQEKERSRKMAEFAKRRAANIAWAAEQIAGITESDPVRCVQSVLLILLT